MDKEQGIITDQPFFNLYLNASSWARESHGLFDYDNRYVDQQNLSISNTCVIGNEDNMLDAVTPFEAYTNKNLHKLFTIAFKNSRYWIYHSRDFEEDDLIK